MSEQPQLPPEFEPLAEGIERIAKFTSSTAERLGKDIERIEKDGADRFEKVNEKIERGLGSVMDRIETLSKRASVFGRMNIDQDDAEALKDALPDHVKDMLPIYEQVCESSQFKKGSRLADPRFAAATAQILKWSAKLRVGAFAHEREQIVPLLNKMTDRFNAILKAPVAAGTDTAGGYMVPNIVGTEVLRLIKDASDIYPLARQMPMTSDTLNIPDETTAVTINWVSELGAMTGGEPVFGQKQILAKKVVGRASASMEVLEDSNVALLPYLQTVFAEKIGGELDFQAAEGAGSPFTGLIGAASVNAIAATTGTAGANVSWDLITQTFVKAGEKNTRADGVWIMSPAIFGKVIGLVDSNGQPIVKFGTTEFAPNGTILGRPVIVSNRLTSITVGSDATGNIYFGPPRALIFATRTAMRWDVTDQVGWATGQIDVRLIGRFGYIVGVPAAWTRLTKLHND